MNKHDNLLLLYSLILRLWDWCLRLSSRQHRMVAQLSSALPGLSLAELAELPRLAARGQLLDDEFFMQVAERLGEAGCHLCWEGSWLKNLDTTAASRLVMCILNNSRRCPNFEPLSCMWPFEISSPGAWEHLALTGAAWQLSRHTPSGMSRRLTQRCGCWDHWAGLMRSLAAKLWVWQKMTMFFWAEERYPIDRHTISLNCVFLYIFMLLEVLRNIKQIMSHSFVVSDSGLLWTALLTLRSLAKRRFHWEVHYEGA